MKNSKTLLGKHFKTFLTITKVEGNKWNYIPQKDSTSYRCHVQDIWKNKSAQVTIKILETRVTSGN